MSATPLVSLLVLLVGLMEPPPVDTGPVGGTEPPGDATLLVHSELDYLVATKRKITVQMERAEPAAILKLIAKASGLTIEVRGVLPKEPALSVSFRDTEARVILEWFAERVPVSFKAEPPGKLAVIVAPAREAAR